MPHNNPILLRQAHTAILNLLAKMNDAERSRLFVEIRDRYCYVCGDQRNEAGKCPNCEQCKW